MSTLRLSRKNTAILTHATMDMASHDTSYYHKLDIYYLCHNGNEVGNLRCSSTISSPYQNRAAELCEVHTQVDQE